MSPTAPPGRSETVVSRDEQPGKAKLEKIPTLKPEIAAAYAIARDAFDLIGLNAGIDALDAKIPGKIQLGLYGAIQELVVDRMRWFLRRGVARPGAIEQTVAHYAKGVAALAAALPTILPEAAAQARTAAIATLIAEQVPEALATSVASLPWLAQATDIVDIAGPSAQARHHQPADDRRWAPVRPSTSVQLWPECRKMMCQ